MNEKRYPSDLTLREWATIQPLFPRAKRRGRPPKHSKKVIVNGILYIVRTGCQWYALPKDYPPFQTVYDWFAKWTKSGLWGRVLLRLNARGRVRAGREPEPSAVIIDSQSVKSGGISDEVGFDGGKGIYGRKRHILVDVLGLLLGVSVTGLTCRIATKLNVSSRRSRMTCRDCRRYGPMAATPASWRPTFLGASGGIWRLSLPPQRSLVFT